MDLKGITWVGDFYQKLEARLLEVEEIMCEEAVKYVENQMQTVTDNVRKFYSEVMQDLCTPDSEDPANGAVSKLPGEQCADVSIYTKAKVGMSMKEKCEKVADVEQLTEDSKMTNDLGSNRLALSQRISARRTSRKLCQASLSNKSNLDINKKSKSNNISSKEAPGITDSSVCELSNQNRESSSDQKAEVTTLGSVEVTGYNSLEEFNSEIENASEHVADSSFDEPSSYMAKMVETRRSKEMDMRISPSGNLLEESDGICLNTRLVSPVESSANWGMQSNKFSYEEDFLSNSDEWGMDSNEDDTLVKEGMEIIQQADKVRLEETCVIVDGDEFPRVPHLGKNRPHKKLIRDVFSSRKRLARKEYEQLAVQCSTDLKSNLEESVNNSMPTLATKEAERHAAHDLSESEWELV